jgi:hypothetical protein
MSTAGQSRLSVRQALLDRCLTVASPESAAALTRHINASGGGLVFSSTQGTVSQARAIHAKFPGLILVPDPRERDEQPATPQAPLVLPNREMAGQLTLDGSVISQPTLQELIDAQFRSGADVGVIPGRFVRAEDSDALAAIIAAGNSVDRDDVIVRVPCHYPWLRPDEDHAGQLIAILGRSRHPVALSPADWADPMDQKGVAAGTRMVAEALGGQVMLWKSDLAGLDALVRGALGTAIGVIPSLRHSCPPGGPGKAIDRTDKAPRIFLPRLLRYVRSSYMHDEWFASTDPWTCDCGTCHGRPVDRFTGSERDLAEAAAHNAIAITALHRDLTALPGGHRLVLWREKLEQADLAHTELSIYIQRQVDLPKVLQYWLNNT